MTRRAVLLAAAALWLAAPWGAAQVLGPFAGGGDVQINPRGPQFGFRDDEDPDRFVLVFLDGIEVIQGDRRLTGKTLVAVVGGPRGGAAAADGGDQQSLHELYIEGDVTVEMAGERVTRAEAVYIDLDSDLMAVAHGELRVTVEKGTLYIRFEEMRAITRERRVIENVTFSSCGCGDRDWHIRTERATVEETPHGRVLTTQGNTLVFNGIPVLWWPGMRINLDTDRIPLREVEFGSSSRFGTKMMTAWGGSADEAVRSVLDLFGVTPDDVDAEWELEVAWYSKRGLFVEPALTYDTDDSYGRLFGAFIDDKGDEDSLDVPLMDHSRGRIDLEHRTVIDEHQVLDIEFSDISDRNFLNEYYENEFRNGKEQESYVNYRNVVDNHAIQVLFRSRTNAFQTQVEYLPAVEHRIVGEDVGPILGQQAFLTARSFADNARLRFDEDVPGVQDVRNVRFGSRAQIDMPIDVGDDRVVATASADVTHFSHSADGGDALRTAAAGQLSWSRTYSGVDPTARSETWNIDGIRHIVEPMVSYFSLFHLSHATSELRPIDSVEMLSRFERLAVGLRDRIQTHQRGRVVTLLDTEVIIPLYLDKDRDNDPDGDGSGDVKGNILVDSIWTPGANVFLLENSRTHWRAELDPNDGNYVESYLSFSTALGPDRTFLVANNKAKHVFNFVTFAAQWVLDPKWSYAVFWQEDVMLHETAWVGFVLRRREKCWITDAEISMRRGDSASGKSEDDIRFEVTVTPAILDGREPLLEKVSRRVR